MRHVRLAGVLLLLAPFAWGAEKSELINQVFPAAPGKVVWVDAGPLDLLVRAAEVPEIRVRIELSASAFKEKQALAWIEGHRPVLSDTPEQLRIDAPDPSGLKLFRGVVASKALIEVVVPNGVRPDVSTSDGTLRLEGEFSGGMPLRARAASGEIELAGWAPEVELRSTSGDLRIRASRAIGSLLVRTASGNVVLTGGARSVRCDSSSGSVLLEGLVGPIGLATTSGDVTASFDTLERGDEVHITTTSGKVRITLPPQTAPGGELASARGQIRSLYPGDADSKGGRLRLAGGGPKVVVTTTSGKIDLN